MGKLLPGQQDEHKWKILDFKSNLDYVIPNQLHRANPVRQPTIITMILTTVCAGEHI